MVRRVPSIALMLALLTGALGVAPGCTDDEPAGNTSSGNAPPAVADPQPDPQPEEPPAVRFRDVTREAGIDFVHVNGARGEKLLPETMGGGCAFLDYDGDGDQDLLLVGSRHWPGDDDRTATRSSLALYRNDGVGRFEDVTAAAGLELQVYGMGAAVGDYDADGDVDVFVTALGPDRLLRNDDGVFTDVAGAVGVSGASDGWSSAAAFLDHDGDGDLDLFVCRYVDWSRDADLGLTSSVEGLERAYAPPMRFGGTFPSLYRNDGGAFTDVSREAGLHVVDAGGAPLCKALALAVEDFDGDGRPDVYVANDTARNVLFMNRGGGRFTEEGRERGVAYDLNGNATGAMGVDTGHLRDPADLALFVGNFADEMTSVYVSQDDRMFFAEETVERGIGLATRPAVTFGLFLFDYDLDGRLDLLAANGDLDADIGTVQPGRSYRQPTQLFWNAGPDAEQTFVPVPADATGDLATPLVGRGAAYADIDADGDLDVLLTQVGDAPRLLRNEQALGRHWLRCRLVGAAGNPDALGARVEVVAGGRTQWRTVMPTRSYLSQVELPVTFGLGDAGLVESLSVTWPDGSTQQLTDVAVDQELVIRQDASRAEFARLMNLARARLEGAEHAAALELQTAALDLVPDSVAGLRNLARIHLGQGRPELAEAPLARARELAADSVATTYLTGVALARQARFEEALVEFERAARLDPLTAALRFQLAEAYAAVGRADDAHEQLRETVALDPAHSAAQFRLAMSARKAGDTDAYRQHNREFLRLQKIYGERYKTPLSLEVCAYTRAEPADPQAPGTRPPPPAGIAVRLPDATTGLLGALAGQPVAATAVVDMDERGAYTLFTAAPDGSLALTTFAADGMVDIKPVGLSLPPLGRVTACIAGDFHDVVPAGLMSTGERFRYTDVFLLTDDAAYLLQQTGPDTYQDVTARARLGGLSGSAARWVDYEHDGDLDLLLGRPDGLQLWQNNSAGSFSEVGAAEGIPEIEGAIALAAVDLDDDATVDLVVARGEAPTLVLENQRAGRFAPMPEPPGPWAAARAIVADDLDNDGLADVVLVGDDEAVLLLGQGTSRARIDIGDLVVSALTLVDYDNDGWLDLCAAGRRRDAPEQGALRVWRNGGAGAWRDVSAELAAAGADGLLPDPSATGPLTSVTALDLDDDGDSDLLLRSAADRLVALRNDGGHVNGQLRARLESKMQLSGAIGTHVSLHAGDRHTSRWLQDDLPVEIGLGGLDRIDSVQTVWTNGVVTNRLDVVPGDDPLQIVVYQFVDTGSCPFLYTWDGERFRFVTDLIGSGALGLPMSRDVMYPVNPIETVVIGGDDVLAPRDGEYVVQVTSELREIAYMDTFRLLAVDHAPGVEIGSSDMLQGPPFRPSETWALSGRRPLRSARGDDGIDRTEALRELDGGYAPPGPLRPPPLRGSCEPMSLELDFGELPADRPLVLALTGWIEYGTASSDIALSQVPDLELIWPRLESRDADGRWVTLDVATGLPAGKGKTVLVDLAGALPEGADRLRLTTTYQVSWDRAALFERVPLDAARVHAAPFARAELGWRGFSELITRRPLQPKTPDHDVVTDRPTWRTALEGWCTAYGDVRELLDERDGKLVVLNAGDALSLALPVDAFPPVPDGMERTFCLSTVGWNREGDVNTRGGDRVWPMPVDTTHGRHDPRP
jgi:tetratricopeptide (TPR) repeat protein